MPLYGDQPDPLRDPSNNPPRPALPPGNTSPALIRTRSLAAGTDPAVVSDRLSTLVHELASLLDGSLRQVSLVTGTLQAGNEDRAALLDIERRMVTVKAALEQMSRCVHAAMPRAARFPDTGSLADAVASAAEIVEPLASDRSVVLHVQIAAELRSFAPLCAYTVVLNAVRNAVEALTQAGSSSGTVNVRATVLPVGQGKRALIEIDDDGPGLPPSSVGELTRPGVTTKRGHLGVGLALVLDLVQQAGGTLELANRSDTRGARLRVTLPMIDRAGQWAAA